MLRPRPKQGLQGLASHDDRSERAVFAGGTLRAFNPGQASRRRRIGAPGLTQIKVPFRSTRSPLGSRRALERTPTRETGRWLHCLTAAAAMCQVESLTQVKAPSKRLGYDVSVLSPILTARAWASTDIYCPYRPRSEPYF
jgi:hypothetical protein